MDLTGHFEPESAITWGQAVVWLARSLKLIPTQQKAPLATTSQFVNQQLLQVYGVGSNVPENQQEALATLLSAGFSSYLLDSSGHLRDLSAPLEAQRLFR